MYKVQFNIEHKGCWGSDIHIKFPEMKFSSVDVRWVKGKVAHVLVADVLEAKGSSARFKEVIAYLKKNEYVKKVEPISEDKDKIYLRTLTRHTDKHEQFSDIFFDNNLFPVAPVKFIGKHEQWTLATAEKKNITKVYEYVKKKHPIKINYIKEDSIHSELTSKQREVIGFAKHFGYYKWPRAKTASEIAAILDIPKTVFLSHLRKAENKIIENALSSK